MKLNCNFKAVTVLRAGNSAVAPASRRTRMLLGAEADLSLPLLSRPPKFTHSSQENRINKLIIIRFTSGYFVNREQIMCLRGGHTPAPSVSLLCFVWFNSFSSHRRCFNATEMTRTIRCGLFFLSLLFFFVFHLSSSTEYNWLFRFFSFFF